ncbi:MAG: DUF6125 family protein [Chloroflexota bacterium]|nr:DUF6125 family protein [Chloroflexota bacterium]
MELLSDYSGAFDPDFSHEKLSREALLRILKSNSDYLRRLDGTWYVKVMDKCGNDIAFECDSEIWEQFIFYELKTACDLMNIRGNDVETLMKAMQATQWMWIHDRTFELINKNHGIITYRNCQTLFHLEKEGTGRWATICHVLERRLFELTAKYFNPKIKLTPLKLPPRDDGSDISCQWEFKLEE